MKIRNPEIFLHGVHDGIPIMLGYLAVGFSLGIAAKNANMTAIQGFFASLLNNASAGEYAAFTMIASDAGYAEVALITLVANARYLLMSCSLSQKFSPDTPFYHRLIIGFDVTDEIFAVTVSRPGILQPAYSYGVISVALPGWSIGTLCGVIAGSILPSYIVSALSVALYGMFLAIIIPPVRKNKVLACVIPISFTASFLFSRLPVFSSVSGGNRTIILTVLIAGIAAALFPVKETDEDIHTGRNDKEQRDRKVIKGKEKR